MKFQLKPFFDKYYFGVIFLILFFSFNDYVFAQTDTANVIKNKFEFTLGTGVNLILFPQLILESSGEHREQLVYNAMFDYRITPIVSIGLAFSDQKITVNRTGNILTDDFKDILRCTSTGIRVLLHRQDMAFDKLDIYGGTRINFTIWTPDTTNPDPQYEPFDNANLGFFNYQLLGGVSYYFNDNIAMNFETGLGTYLFGLGLKIGFN